ncbi:hypothetical protein ACM66B_003173 [Microbotryomycetes sp. NB124-2]
MSHVPETRFETISQAIEHAEPLQIHQLAGILFASRLPGQPAHSVFQAAFVPHSAMWKKFLKSFDVELSHDGSVEKFERHASFEWVIQEFWLAVEIAFKNVASHGQPTPPLIAHQNRALSSLLEVVNTSGLEHAFELRMERISSHFGFSLPKFHWDKVDLIVNAVLAFEADPHGYCVSIAGDTAHASSHTEMQALSHWSSGLNGLLSSRQLNLYGINGTGLRAAEY